MNNNTTIVNGKGQILLFGLKHFIQSIVEGDACFICGASPNEKEFNNERVIPNWLLKKHSLHDKKITLPNNTHLSYGKYKTPCCADCNTQLGEQIESPISNLLQNDYAVIKTRIKEDPNLLKLLFHWLCLIYLKTHLKDTQLNLSRDTRTDNGKIGDLHYWDEMHHVHCMSRVHYTQAQVEDDVYGSILIFSTLTPSSEDFFDFIDNSTGKTIMLQSSNFCIMAALTDSKAGSVIMEENIARITTSIHPLQMREIFSRLSFICNSIKDKPHFFSTLENGHYTIGAEVPDKIYLESLEERQAQPDYATPGDYLHFYIGRLFAGHPDEEKFLEDIKSGKIGFVFDENGEFIIHDII